MVQVVTTGYWDLEDLAMAKDITDDYGLTRSTLCNWAARYADFPAPLVTLATGAVYSRCQVAAWLAGHPTLGIARSSR
jgi:hypothetical protein